MTIYEVEPLVIDDELLKRAALEQVQQELPEAIRREAAEPTQIQSLRLDYKNILKIDNLWSYGNLVKLQLDNNVIEKIENLHHLKQLTWLDLSFNKIKRIEGLDQLTRLTDLTLYSNEISALENLEALQDLEVLSVGKNKLTSMTDLAYLLPFEKLRVLNVAGNPFCETDPEYKPYALARLKHLRYLDYRLVEPDHVKQAQDMYSSDIKTIELRDTVRRNEDAQKAVQQAQQAKLQDAHIATLETLFTSMFAEDPSYSSLLALDGQALRVLQDDYEKSVRQPLQELSEVAVRGKELRRAELEDCRRCLQQAYTQLLATQRQQVRAHLKLQKHTLNELEETEMDEAAASAKINELKAAHEQLQGKLMESEMTVTDQVETLIGEFESNFKHICERAEQEGKAVFATLQEADAAFQAQVSNVTTASYDRLSVDEDAKRNTTDQSLNELLSNRDNFLDAVSGSNKYRRAKLDAALDALLRGISADREQMTGEIREAEKSRHWNRVAEFLALRDSCEQAMRDCMTAS